MMQILLMDIEVRGCSSWKTIKNRQFWPFLAQVDLRHGQLLGPLLVDPAEISHGKRAREWLQMIGISLMCIKVRRANEQAVTHSNDHPL